VTVADPRHEAGDGQRGTLEQLVLAGLGWAAMTADAADELADELAQKVGVERERMRQAVRDTVARWRGEAEKAAASRTETTDKLLAKLGLVRREEVDELGLKVAQLEHRLRLLERERSE
jgi:polyhydroxyalkanoate synthesis regulator phasin